MVLNFGFSILSFWIGHHVLFQGPRLENTVLDLPPILFMKFELHCERFVPLRNSKVLHTVSWHTIKPGTPEYQGIAGYQEVKGSEFLENLMPRLFSLGILM